MLKNIDNVKFTLLSLKEEMACRSVIDIYRFLKRHASWIYLYHIFWSGFGIDSLWLLNLFLFVTALLQKRKENIPNTAPAHRK
jgi:hypothetical protein